MFRTERTGFDHQFHGDQYRVEPMDGDGGQHLRHHLISTWVSHQPAPQLLKRRRHVGKGGTVSQRPWLALHQWDVVLPVIADLSSLS